MIKVFFLSRLERILRWLARWLSRLLVWKLFLNWLSNFIKDYSATMLAKTSAAKGATTVLRPLGML